MATTTPKTSLSPRRPVIPAVTSPQDRLAYLWLALAIVFLTFGTARGVLIGVALTRRRKTGETGTAEPLTASPAETSPSEAVPTEAQLPEPRPPSREPSEAVLSEPKPSSGEPPAARPS